MASDRSVNRYRRVYALLLRLYPRPFRRRFASSMEQTFQDLCAERRAAGKGLFPFALGLFAETLAAVLIERIAMIMPPRKKILRLALITALLLAVPLTAMRFGDGVDWSVFDFVFAGVLVFGTGLAFEVLAARARHSSYRAAVGLGLAAGFLLIWVNGAVGIIGSENNPANALYLGVLIVAASGAALARLRPGGMARAMYATALAQLLVPVIAILVYGPQTADSEAGADLVRVLFFNAAFALLFMGSGLLFRHAGAGNPPTVSGQPTLTH